MQAGHPFKLSTYSYILPEERIAAHPLPQRDEACMLVYKAGTIGHHSFKDLPGCLPPGSTLVFNETRVVHARMLFRRSTGAEVEQMSLENGVSLETELLGKYGREVKVRFSWAPAHMQWSEILALAGRVPLPPYIKREANTADQEEYQTVYAREEGAVAAPTAGLHFTEGLMQELEAAGTAIEKLVLHVGAGTFQPVEHEDVREHPMHNEQVVYEKAFIERMAEGEKQIIAVGTTAMRALESLYWFGMLLERDFHPTATNQLN